MRVKIKTRRVQKCTRFCVAEIKEYKISCIGKNKLKILKTY